VKISAYYDLALRPMALNGLFLFALALMLPGLMPNNLAEPFFLYWGQDVVPAAVSDLLWRETLIMPAAFGVVAGAMAASLRGVPLAGTLPGVRRAASLGTLQIMIIVLLITAYLHHGFGGHPLAAMGIASVLYTAWVLQPNGIQWNIIRLIAAASVLLWLRPSVLDGAAAAASLPVALLAPVSAVWLMRSLRDPAHLRRQSLSPLTPQPASGWQRLVQESNAVRRPARNAGTRVSWFRVAASAGLGGARSWLTTPAYVSAWWSVMGYFFAGPMNFLVYPALLSSASSRGLPGAFLYPVSRARRATLAYGSAMVFSAIFVAVGAGITLLMFKLKPFAGMMEEVPRLNPPLLTIIGLMAVWMPIGMWSSLRPPVPDPTERLRGGWNGRGTVAVIISTLLYMVCLGLSIVLQRRVLGAFSPVRQALIFAALAVLTHSIFLALVHRAYGRRDLV
jgi:hypothetical protein